MLEPLAYDEMIHTLRKAISIYEKIGLALVGNKVRPTREEHA